MVDLNDQLVVCLHLKLCHHHWQLPHHILIAELLILVLLNLFHSNQILIQRFQLIDRC